MTAYVSFEAAVEPLIWGRSTYTILRLPEDVEAQLGSTNRVEGEINEHPVNMGIARANVVAGAFLWTGKAFLKTAQIEPGQPVDVRLRPAPNDLIEMAQDVTTSLNSAGRQPQWDALTPGKKRAHLHQINSAKRPETRAKRIAALIATLGGGT